MKINVINAHVVRVEASEVPKKSAGVLLEDNKLIWHQLQPLRAPLPMGLPLTEITERLAFLENRPHPNHLLISTLV